MKAYPTDTHKLIRQTFWGKPIQQLPDLATQFGLNSELAVTVQKVLEFSSPLGPTDRLRKLDASHWAALLLLVSKVLVKNCISAMRNRELL